MISAKSLLSRILFFLYIFAIAFLCFMHTDSMPEVQQDFLGIPIDKIAHFLMFLPFPVLAFLAYDHKTDKPWRCIVFALLTLLGGAVVAGLTEYIQGRLPYRSMDINDFKADMLALTLSTIMVFLVDITHLKKRN